MAGNLYVHSDLSGPFGAYTARVNETNGIDEGQIVKPTGSTEATTTNYKQGGGIIQVSVADANGDEALTCGIALKDQDDGGEIAIATRGIFLMRAKSAITIGKSVGLVNAGADTTGYEIQVAASGQRPFGVALTGCSAENEYVLVLVNTWGWSVDGADTA